MADSPTTETRLDHDDHAWREEYKAAFVSYATSHSSWDRIQAHEWAATCAFEAELRCRGKDITPAQRAVIDVLICENGFDEHP